MVGENYPGLSYFLFETASLCSLYCLTMQTRWVLSVFAPLVLGLTQGHHTQFILDSKICLFVYYVCSILPACIPTGQKRILYLIINGYEPPSGCWELNLGLLKEQPMLLISAPFLQLLILDFCCLVWDYLVSGFSLPVVAVCPVSGGTAHIKKQESWVSLQRDPMDLVTAQLTLYWEWCFGVSHPIYGMAFPPQQPVVLIWKSL